MADIAAHPASDGFHAAVLRFTDLYYRLPGPVAKNMATTAVQLMTNWIGWMWGLE